VDTTELSQTASRFCKWVHNQNFIDYLHFVFLGSTVIVNLFNYANHIMLVEQTADFLVIYIRLELLFTGTKVVLEFVQMFF
jgi:hypothetical protein